MAADQLNSRVSAGTRLTFFHATLKLHSFLHSTEAVVLGSSCKLCSHRLQVRDLLLGIHGN